MKLLRNCHTIGSTPWGRYKYNITTGIGENGQRVTGCKEHIDLSRRVATEGMVLLENNGILPLKKGTAVSLFGIGSIDYVSGGGGSGRVYSAYVRDVYEGFCEKADKVKIYEPLTKFYMDYALPIVQKQGGYEILTQPELPQSLIDDAAKNSDVAIITIHRFSGEDWDRSAKKGDFYLTDQETDMVNRVTAAFDHSIVVLDVGGMIDTEWFKQNKKIDAALLAWQAGMEGGLAIADIICGDVNPSGKLVDTFARTFADYPSADSFNQSNDYVCYYEDIYVGYRYFETIPGAKERVNYPFGHGLSYTTFEISTPIAKQVNEKIEVSLNVKNTGKVAGKEVAQVYFSAPQGILGKSAIELAAFKKTKLLAPGETEEITLSFNINDMASYDDLGKLQMSAFVLEKGEYKFFVGNSCRNLKEAEYKYVVTEKFIVTEQLAQRLAPTKLAKRMLSDGSFEELPSTPIVKYEVDEEVNPCLAPQTQKPVRLDQVLSGQYSLDEFIAQATIDELITIVGGSRNTGLANTAGMGGGFERLSVPPLMTADGPAGLRINPKSGIATTAWPCATLIACSWDPDLIYELGVAGAKECKENAFPIWLTPALNIHRNPLCGRNFEYFSEDPLLAGKFAAAKVKGIQSQGVVATPKHFACNNKETNRKYSDSRVSERALREIYLKGFEICIKEADPWLLMASYNLINSRRCMQSYELLTAILREEWGFNGAVTSDWHTPGDTVYNVLYGCDISMPEGYPKQLKDGLLDGRLKRGHLETCAKRILSMYFKIEK